MTTPSEKLLTKLGIKQTSPSPEQDINKENGRRDFLKKAGTGGLMLGAFMFSSIEDTLAHSTSNVNRHSSPSDLKITDMRYAVVSHYPD